jgi:hypothetical protein
MDPNGLEVASRPRLCHPISSAAYELGIGRSSLFVLLKRREIDSILVAGRRVIPHDSLVSYVHRLQKESGAEGPTPSAPHLEAADAAATST